MALNRRKFLSSWLLALVALILITIYIYHRRAPDLRREKFLLAANDHEIPPGGKLSRGNVTSYINSIINPHATHLPKLDCLRPDLSQYKYLRPSISTSSKTQYFFAVNLRENLPILPRLLGSIVEAIEFLGPQNCALSIVEGNSPDGTGDVLAALEPRLDSMLKTYFVLGNEIDPLTDSRFAKLAQLRNLALSPMLQEPERYSNATVIFLNDVVICPDDILELVHQRASLGADMTCAMDWVYGSDVATFYDVYIARGINGDLFFEVPPDISWSKATNLFWNDPESKARFEAGQPVQVFACWNGAVAFTAEPVVRKQVAFRAAREGTGECYNGEPEIFCKDLWFHGHGKIAMLPHINLVYSNEMGKRIKDEKGFTSQRAGPVTLEDVIEWKPPPHKVKCMPTFDRQSWHVWNETLGEDV